MFVSGNEHVSCKVSVLVGLMIIILNLIVLWSDFESHSSVSGSVCQRRPSSRWPADEEGQILIGHFTVCRFKKPKVQMKPHSRSTWDPSLSRWLRAAERETGTQSLIFDALSSTKCINISNNILILQISHTDRSGDRESAGKTGGKRLKRGNREKWDPAEIRKLHLGWLGNHHGNGSISLCIMGCVCVPEGKL